MLSKQFLFIALCITFFISIAYFSYYLCKKYNIELNRKFVKLKKAFLLYIFPILSVFFIICFLAYFLLINISVSLALTLIGVFCCLGFILIFIYKSIVLGTIIITSSLLITFGLFNMNIDSLKVMENKQITSIELYNYSEKNLFKEEIFINLSSKDITYTQSNTTNVNKNKIYIYAFMQYDKTDKYDFPFLLQNIEYEIIDDDNNRIEITTKTIVKYNILSYFEFTEPTIEYEDSYKLFLNENNIKFD